MTGSKRKAAPPQLSFEATSDEGFFALPVCLQTQDCSALFLLLDRRHVVDPAADAFVFAGLKMRAANLLQDS
jgi:hypothetical protein